MYRKFYRWMTWATVEQACSDKPMPWHTRLARRWLPVPKEDASHD